MMKFFLILLSILLVGGCSGGGNSNDNNIEDTSGNTSGVITLTGADTTMVGTQLNPGSIGASLAAESQPDYIVIVDQSSSVTFTPPNVLTPDIADPDNWFVLVVMDDAPVPVGAEKGISMSITTDGEKFDYICHTDAQDWSVECGVGSISLNIAAKTVAFDNTTVINTDTGTLLTLNGSLTWSGTTTESDSGTTVVSNGTATELEGSWVDVCVEIYPAYEVNGTITPGSYESGITTFSGNTFTYSGADYSDSECTIVEETYINTGTFIIGDSMTTSSGLSAKNIDIAIVTMDGRNVSYKFYDIFKIDGDRLYFGDQGSYDENEDDWEYSGLTVEKRPIDLDFSFYSIRE